MNERRDNRSTVIVTAVGAVLSLAMLLNAGRHGTPLLVLILMAVWVLSPFLFLFVATAMSAQWPAQAARVLRRVTVVVSLGSVALYAADTLNHLAGRPAAVYVMVPPIMWLVGVIIVGVALLRTRTKRA
jgi:hypothetical protein